MVGEARVDDFDNELAAGAETLVEEALELARISDLPFLEGSRVQCRGSTEAYDSRELPPARLHELLDRLAIMSQVALIAAQREKRVARRGAQLGNMRRIPVERHAQSQPVVYAEANLDCQEG